MTSKIYVIAIKCEFLLQTYIRPSLREHYIVLLCFSLWKINTEQLTDVIFRAGESHDEAMCCLGSDYRATGLVTAPAVVRSPVRPAYHHQPAGPGRLTRLSYELRVTLHILPQLPRYTNSLHKYVIHINSRNIIFQECLFFSHLYLNAIRILILIQTICIQ